MYVPPAFREDDLAALHGTMREARLANLVTATAEGLIATPLPLFLAPEEGPYGTLYGHLARANPQWKLPPTGDAMALFMGPDAYVSPSWYPSKREHGKVVELRRRPRPRPGRVLRRTRTACSGSSRG
jgi:transcriptional regulator